MHANEVSMSTSLVRELVVSQFPEYTGLPIEPVPSSGTDNFLFKLGDALVVRLPRLADKARHIEKEYHWLPKLAPYLPIAVPHPVALGKPGVGYPFVWAIYAWLEGMPASESAALDSIEVVNELADFIIALQKIATAGAPVPVGDFDRGQPLARRDQYTRDAIAKLQDSYDTQLLSLEWERALHTRPWHGAPVWIHGDLDGRNMLVNDGRLAAVIDFGSIGIGDPAYDAMVAWKIFSSGTRQAFKERLSLDEATWARARGLVLSQATMILSYYTDKTNTVLVKEARGWMRELGF